MLWDGRKPNIEFMKYPFIIAAGILVASCGNQSNQSGEQADVRSQAGNVHVELSQVWETDTTTFMTPECVTYDSVRNQFYVSNINRQSEAENAGYISLVDADGSVKDAQWITGFTGPLGNDFHGDYLYVNDRSVIVKIDIAAGEIVERITVDSAVALNGIDIAEDGTIYAADSRTNKIFRVQPTGEIDVVVASDSLETPNGVLIQDNELLVASSDGGSLKSVNLSDGSIKTLVTGIGQADGIISLGDGRYLSSSWKGEVYFINENMEQQKILDTQADAINAADMGYIPEENLVVVPTFHDNRLVAYRLSVH